MVHGERPTEADAKAMEVSPISSSVSSTASLAPPCSGPLSAPIAPVTAECRSARVEVMTRAVNVEALKECSA